MTADYIGDAGIIMRTRVSGIYRAEAKCKQ